MYAVRWCPEGVYHGSWDQGWPEDVCRVAGERPGGGIGDMGYRAAGKRPSGEIGDQ